MLKKLPFLPILTICCIFLLPLVFRCDAGLNGQIEYADFLLDNGEFEDAITLLTVLDNQYPDSVEIKFRLASAYLASAVLGTDRTYLSIVADYFESPPEGQTDFQHFASKSSHMDGDQLLDLARARMILDEEISDSSKTKNAWLQLAFARLLEIIAIGVIRVGADTPDEHCNNDPNQGPDGVPDGYDPSVLSAQVQAQFDENVDRVDDDFINAGFAADSGIVTKVRRIATALSAFSTLADYLDDQYGVVVGCP